MIRNEYQITKKLYRQWGFENAIKGTQLAFGVVWVLLAISVLVLDILDGGYFLYHILFVFCIYRAFFRWLVVTNAQYRVLAKRYRNENWVRSISFEKDKIRIKETTISIEYNYADIVQIKEKENKVWLIASNKTVIRLYKDCFIESTWEDCKKLFPPNLFA